MGVFGTIGSYLNSVTVNIAASSNDTEEISENAPVSTDDSAEEVSTVQEETNSETLSDERSETQKNNLLPILIGSLSAAAAVIAGIFIVKR